MSKRSFCTLKSADFLDSSVTDKALRELMEGHVSRHNLESNQVMAWSEELSILAEIATAYPNSLFALEYMIPRMGKRVDAVALIQNCVFVIEFKVGKGDYPSADVDQVLDYAYDLKNFHKASHDKKLYPILCCTEAPSRSNDLGDRGDGIFDVQFANAQTLAQCIENSLRCSEGEILFDHEEWLDALYSPTPTIVEAAQALYESNQVEDISRNEAGLTNINATTARLEDIVSFSKKELRKSICFVTGVPGAGKTLVGLNLASKRRSEGDNPSDETAVFLSGNGPLIEVLQSSLTRDQQKRDLECCDFCEMKRSRKCKQSACPHYRTKAEIEAEVKTFIQGVHLFREELFLSDAPPHEHVAVFDESQRAWSREQLSFKMKTRRQNKRIVDASEPECLIEYMDRHPDWAVMICLVGGGQEIHQGEAGIDEWFNALAQRFPNWDIYTSPAIASPYYLGDANSVLQMGINYCDELHLSVDMRSFRNINVAAFAEALVENEPERATELYPNIIETYPIVITRDLNKAKEWVRSRTRRPSDRYGVVADSYGQRIRADGITVPMDFDAPTWFLEGKDNIDSSYFMEVAASEFKIQGLEIDYAIVAWEGDYRYVDGKFNFHRFYGNKWQNVNAEMPRRYLKNGYRVLLTRARQGYVIYVPRGSEYDPTRPPSYYDGTYQYLKGIGIREL